jgi:ABC-type multidrug transport system fused ATPase/permease subunit
MLDLPQDNGIGRMKIRSSRLKSKLNGNDFIQATSLLNFHGKVILGMTALVQIFSGVLDLIGVMAIGILGSMAINIDSSSNSNFPILRILRSSLIGHYSQSKQITILSLTAIFALMLKTVMSIVITRKILVFLSRRGAETSSVLFRKLLTQSLLKTNEKNSQDNLYIVTFGVEVIFLRILGTGVTMIADFSLMILIIFGLCITDFTMAITTISLFGIVAFLLNKLLHTRVLSLGFASTERNIESNKQIVEALNSIREIKVRNREDFYSKSIKKTRVDLADLMAEITFLPYVSKYAIETIIILGAAVVVAPQVILGSPGKALAALTLFMAAGARLAPAVLRIQQANLLIKGNLGAARATFNLLAESKRDSQLEKSLKTEIIDGIDDFVPDIRLSNVSFAYPESDNLILNDVSLYFAPGEIVAIVGKSGSGKSTLVDLCLGILKPKQGSAKISSLDPNAAFSKWPGSVGYVPQTVFIVDGTIRENVCLGFNPNDFSDEDVLRVMSLANLNEYLDKSTYGLETQVGEGGYKLSGGQRQRLGIARALITNPKLVILDEATSSLDPHSEKAISDSLLKIRGNVTIVLIAHRMSTIRLANRIMYVGNSTVKSFSNLQEVRNAIPDFDYQVKIMDNEVELE